MTNPDMDAISWTRFILASAVVIGLMALFGLTLKYVRMRSLTIPGASGHQRRLQIIENLTLDVKRRLVIVRRDNTEHLLLLGQQQDVVVETNLKGSQTDPETKSHI